MDYFETGFFGGNQSAWHGMGNVVAADVLTAAEAIKESELDWEVLQTPVFTELPGRGRILLPNTVANTRSTDGKILGIVGKDYQVVQNVQAFEFVDTLVASGDAKYHTAGSLKEGKRVWLLARVNKNILIGGEESEAIAPFILFTNGHDGSMGVFTAVTPIRVVCWNTLTAALAGAKRVWKTRHTKKVHDRLAMATEAAETLGLSYKFFDKLEEVGNDLIMQKMSNSAFDKFLLKLVPEPEDAKPGSRVLTARETERALIKSIFVSEPNLANIRNTKWGAFQAVAQYHDFEKEVRLRGATEDEREDKENLRRFERSVYDGKMKNVALALLAPEYVANAKRVLAESGREARATALV